MHNLGFRNRFAINRLYLKDFKQFLPCVFQAQGMPSLKLALIGNETRLGARVEG